MSLSGASVERRDQVLFKGAGLWEHHEDKRELLPLPSTFPSSLPCLHAPCWGPGLPALLFAFPSSLCWDGRLSERRRRGGRGGRRGGSANYTEQLWGLLKSRMKQRAAEASAAVGAEKPKCHRELELAVVPTGSNQDTLQPCASRVTASGTAIEPAASPGRGEGKGLVVLGTQG